MKIKFGITVFLCYSVVASLAQQHYQLMGVAVQNFLENHTSKFDEIPITWNMEGAIQADLNDGINYLHENKLVRAEGSLSIVLKKDPTLWYAYYYRGIAKMQQKRYGEALSDLQRALKLNPKLYEAELETAKCYVAMNSLAESERAVKRAIQIDKKRAAAYYIKGWVEESQGKGANAIATFRECLKVDSAFQNARINIAIITLVEKKDEAGAIKELDAVLALDSLQGDALLMRSILVFENNKDQTLRDLSKLILISPGNMVAFYLRGMLLTNMQRYDRGFSDFQTVIKTTSASDNSFEGQQTWIDKKIDIQNVGAYTLTRIYGLDDEDAAKLKQAYCLIVINAFEKSIAVLNSASTLKKEPLAVYLKAVAHEHQGNHIKALSLYNEAIVLDNTIADAYKKRGIYEQELKEWQKSIADLTTVLRLMPDAYVIHKIRGVSYYYNKQLDKAIADYNKYLEHDSANALVIGYRGVAYRDSHQRLNAYIDFANSTNTDVFDRKDMLHLVDSVLQKGDTTLALRALTSFVKASPLFTEAYALKLRLHVKKMEWQPVESGVFDALLNFRTNAPKEDRAYFLVLKGVVLSRTNELEDAIKAFDEAVRFDKSNAYAYLERAKFFLTQNKANKANDDLNKAASLGSSEAKRLLESLKVN